MKRPIPSFTVEIRRRPGRAATPAANFAPLEIKPRRGEFDRDADRAIAAIFGPKPESSAPVAAAKTATTGRVLDSLVIDRPLASEPAVAFSSGAETAREPQTADVATPRPRDDGAPRSKPRKLRATKTKASPSASSPQPATVLEPSPKSPIAEVARPASPKPIALEILETKNASPRTAGAKSKAANKRYIVANAAPPKPNAEIKNATPVVAPASSATVSEAAPNPRKRRILERYVYGNEPKPGERWKLRLRKKR